MAHLYNIFAPNSEYFAGFELVSEKVKNSTTVYVGNLSFYTTEEQLHELFSKCGEIRRIIMGLNKVTKTPCGFSFVEYYTTGDARDAVKYVSGATLDDRVIRIDLDIGFEEGRQYGRGRGGGQVRDDYRTDYDAGRGGYGLMAVQEKLQQKESTTTATTTATSSTPTPMNLSTSTMSLSTSTASLKDSSSSIGKRKRDDEEDGDQQQQQHQHSPQQQNKSQKSDDRKQQGHNEDDDDEESSKNPRFRESEGDD